MVSFECYKKKKKKKKPGDSLFLTLNIVYLLRCLRKHLFSCIFFSSCCYSFLIAAILSLSFLIVHTITIEKKVLNTSSS